MTVVDTLHGIAELWQWGSLQTTLRTDDVELLLRTALDAHLGSANAPAPHLRYEGRD